jgi:monoamine oxidase
MQTDTLIIGGGLSGVCLARGLSRINHDFLLIEARDRLGGRVLSQSAAQKSSDNAVARFDMGPAWVWPSLQPLMSRLTDELAIPLFPQYTKGALLYEAADTAAPQRYTSPSAHAQSYRVAGGAMTIIERLAESIAPDALLLGAQVIRVNQHDAGVTVDMIDAQGSQQAIRAQRVVLAMPPRLMERMAFIPALPDAVRRRWLDTPTWMAGHAKVIALYETPFWREQGLSGEVFSRRGPLSEIYDASPVSGGPYALFGFSGLTAGMRRELGVPEFSRRILDQLQRLFGEQASLPVELLIKDWSDDGLTATASDRVPLMQHPEYGFSQSERAVWEGKILLAGSESATPSGGYLEGALEAALEVLNCLSVGNGANSGRP